MINKHVQRFWIINTIEGYSYLILLFIAMPLKYYFGMPEFVKIAGMINGILFVAFSFLLVEAWTVTKWRFSENVIFFTASLIPFGTLYTKNRIKNYE